MPVLTIPHLFILPDESGLLNFDVNGIHLTAPDGTGAVSVQSGNFNTHYASRDDLGFIYAISSTTGNVWRNTFSFNYTVYDSSLGNVLLPSSGNPWVIKLNNGRILCGSDQALKYTDDLFSSIYDVSIGTDPPVTGGLGLGDNLQFLAYEGGNNCVAMYFGSLSGYFRFFRSTDNGLTYTEQSRPFGFNTFEAIYKV